ncbi:MAG: M16 family metallopeptidase [Minisyncoccales bacterium]
MYRKITLPNGLRIIAVPQKNTQAVTILILVGTGSKYETKQINGISHFLEHLFFKGTKKRPSSLLVAETLDRIGGVYNAFTSEEYTGYFAKTAADYFDLSLDWLADIFFNSLLPPVEIEKERRVIIEEINLYLDTPTLYIGDLWKSLLYGDQPAGWPVAGKKEIISQIKREQILSYLQSQYTATNTLICLAGNFSLSSAIKKIQKFFSKINQSKAKAKTAVKEKQTKPAAILLTKKTDQTHLALGVRTFNLFHPYRFALEILAIILGGMMSSRLFFEIREKLGLAYYVKTENESNTDTGYLVTRVGVDNQRTAKAITAILREYKKIAEKRISAAELKKAKENFKGHLALSLESSDAQASFYGLQEILENKILTPEQIFREVDKITPNDMLKLAKEIFQPARLNLAIIGPFKEKEYFQKLLKL